MTYFNPIQKISKNLQKIVDINLIDDEKVILQLQGAYKEALVGTDQRVLIVKSGFMTGQMFGSDIFQIPYTNISSAEVKFRIFSGYFELSAGGMQNTDKNFWSFNKNRDPAKAPNCISLNARHQADNFRKACAFMMKYSQEAKAKSLISSPIAPDNMDVAESLSRIWKLKIEGAITSDEYEVFKEKLLNK